MVFYQNNYNEIHHYWSLNDQSTNYGILAQICWLNDDNGNEHIVFLTLRNKSMNNLNWMSRTQLFRTRADIIKPIESSLMGFFWWMITMFFDIIFSTYFIHLSNSICANKKNDSIKLI